MTNADFKNLIGRRIRLLHTDDPYTKLKYGDLGTVTDVTITPWDDIQVWCKWDSGSTLAMIDGKDMYEFIAEKKTVWVRKYVDGLYYEEEEEVKE